MAHPVPQTHRQETSAAAVHAAHCTPRVSLECFPFVFGSQQKARRKQSLTRKKVEKRNDVISIFLFSTFFLKFLPHTSSQKRGGDYHAMASSQGVLNEGWKRVGLIDGWCGSECYEVVINTCQCQPMHSSLMCEEKSHVYQSLCVLASLTSFMVLMCAARCGHCARRSDSGMALGMMSLQSIHLTRTW